MRFRTLTQLAHEDHRQPTASFGIAVFLALLASACGGPVSGPDGEDNVSSQSSALAVGESLTSGGNAAIATAAPTANAIDGGPPVSESKASRGKPYFTVELVNAIVAK
jgi:hypothetical protein